MYSGSEVPIIAKSIYMRIKTLKCDECNGILLKRPVNQFSVVVNAVLDEWKCVQR